MRKARKSLKQWRSVSWQDRDVPRVLAYLEYALKPIMDGYAGHSLNLLYQLARDLGSTYLLASPARPARAVMVFRQALTMGDEWQQQAASSELPRGGGKPGQGFDRRWIVASLRFWQHRPR